VLLKLTIVFLNIIILKVCYHCTVLFAI